MSSLGNMQIRSENITTSSLVELSFGQHLKRERWWFLLELLFGFVGFLDDHVNLLNDKKQRVATTGMVRINQTGLGLPIYVTGFNCSWPMRGIIPS